MEKNQPKRRKDRYNPYTIYEEKGKHFIMFRDSQDITQCLEIDESLFNVFNDFELEDLSYLNEFDRHQEHLALSESKINERVYETPQSVEDIVIKNLENELLKKAISKLPKVQRKRLTLYYFEGMTYEQIAKIEGCTYQAVQLSVREALKKLKKALSKYLVI